METVTDSSGRLYVGSGVLLRGPGTWHRARAPGMRHKGAIGLPRTVPKSPGLPIEAPFSNSFQANSLQVTIAVQW